MKGFYLMIAGALLLSLAVGTVAGVVPAFSIGATPCPTTIMGYALANPSIVVTADLVTYAQGQATFGWGPTPSYQSATYQVQGGYTASGYTPTAVFPGYPYGGNQNYPTYFSLNNGMAYQPDGSCSNASSSTGTTTTSTTSASASSTTQSSSVTGTGGSSSQGYPLSAWLFALSGLTLLFAGAWMEKDETQ